MKSKILNIFSYYDTEPMEIIIGIIWFIMLPIIWCFEFYCNLFIIIPSILLGIAMIKATCSHSIKVRKTLSYGSFIFSIFIILAFVIKIFINHCTAVYILTVSGYYCNKYH